METKKAVELERLLSELADEGATKERVQKIEDLLINNPELQDHYWKWMDLHVILGVERAGILGDRGATRSLGGKPENGSPRELRKTTWSSGHQLWMLVSTVAVAACVTWALMTAAQYFRNRDADGPNRGMRAAAGGEEIWRIPRITRVSWEGPFFADPGQEERSTTGERAGLVSLGLVGGLSANGYILRLEPGTSANLMMAADAYAENNLSVTELDANGTPIRRSVSFNNFGTSSIPQFGNAEVMTRRYGQIGTWSEFNDTDRPKYYLLNGIHKSANPDVPAPDSPQEFQLSEMVVMVEEPDIILVGWDDGGVEPTEANSGVLPDGDYDDITVVIRINRPGVEPTRSTPHRRLLARPQATTLTPQSDGSVRYRFALLPGEVAVMKVATEARCSNALYLVDESANEVLWGASNTDSRSTNLGAVTVENRGTEQIHLAIFSEHSASTGGDKDDWQCSELAKIHDQPGCVILGFEDTGEDNDFDDMRVTLLSMSAKQRAPIEEP